MRARLLLERRFRARGLKFDIDLKDPRGQMCRAFEEGNIFAIEYTLPLPDESVLQEDLSDMLYGLYTISSERRGAGRRYGAEIGIAVRRCRANDERLCP